MRYSFKSDAVRTALPRTGRGPTVSATMDLALRCYIALFATLGAEPPAALQWIVGLSAREARARFRPSLQSRPRTSSVCHPHPLPGEWLCRFTPARVALAQSSPQTQVCPSPGGPWRSTVSERRTRLPLKSYSTSD
jgi:hypothetical protein